MIGKEYAAGFMDGEGTIGISISRSTRNYPIPSLRVAFANIDKRPLEAIQARWGGSLAEQKTKVWALHMNGEDAYKLCKDLEPWLIVKRRSAGAALLFFQCGFVSPDENPREYIKKCELALVVMGITREGYHAERTHKMADTLKEAIEHVKQYVATHRAQAD